VHDGATNRVRMRALDVEVVHLFRNLLRACHFADSVHMPPMHNLVCLARSSLLPHIVVQVLADVEDEVLVGAGQPRHEGLPCDVAGLVGVLANSGHDADPAQEELHLVDEFRVHQVKHHPAGRRAPVPAEQPGQQATLKFFVGRQDLVGQALEVVSRANHRQEERSHDLAVAHHAHRLVRDALMHGKVSRKDSLEGRSQLLLVLEFVCADGEVDAIRSLRAVRSRPLGAVAFGDVPAEDQAELVGLLDVAIHRHELDTVALLAAVFQVRVHFADEAVHFFVFASADVVHQVIHTPLASFQRRCGHDEVRGMDVLRSQPHESVERVGTITVDECLNVACGPYEDWMLGCAPDRLFVAKV
jgi:hypothetical protein